MEGKIVLAGGSGFIGRHLVNFLSGKQYKIVVLSRDPEKQRIEYLSYTNQVQFEKWDAQTLTGWEKHLEGALAVVNLAGENIASGKWTNSQKAKIINSRVLAGKILTQALEKTIQKPRVLIQASAIGLYGSRGDETIDETTLPGEGFLAGVVKEWEASTEDVIQMGIRRVVIRMAMVLDTKGGSLPRLLMPFLFFVGGPISSGKQWMSWVHIDDVTNAILFFLKRDDLSGTFNLVSPQPVRNKEFARTLGKIMKRPWFFPVPAFVLKALYGEMAQEVMLSSQRTVPQRLIEAGFSFNHSQLEEALRDLLNPSQ